MVTTTYRVQLQATNKLKPIKPQFFNVTSAHYQELLAMAKTKETFKVKVIRTILTEPKSKKDKLSVWSKVITFINSIDRADENCPCLFQVKVNTAFKFFGGKKIYILDSKTKKDGYQYHEYEDANALHATMNGNRRVEIDFEY